MTSETKEIHFTLLINPQDNSDVDELHRVTHRLLRGLGSIDVESVDFVREQPMQSGAKGTVDPVTLGALAVVVLQTTLPKVLEFLQAWTLRNRDYTLKIKAQVGDRTAEVEYPTKMSPEEVDKHFQAIIDALTDQEQHQ